MCVGAEIHGIKIPSTIESYRVANRTFTVAYRKMHLVLLTAKSRYLTAWYTNVPTIFTPDNQTPESWTNISSRKMLGMRPSSF